MKRNVKLLLAADAVINLILGALLMAAGGCGKKEEQKAETIADLLAIRAKIQEITGSGHSGGSAAQGCLAGSFCNHDGSPF